MRILIIIVIIEIVILFYEIHCIKALHIKEIQAEIQKIIGRDTDISGYTMLSLLQGSE